MGNAHPPRQGLLFTNIPQSAFRNPHFSSFLICHAGEARRGYCVANSGR